MNSGFVLEDLKLILNTAPSQSRRTDLPPESVRISPPSDTDRGAEYGEMTTEKWMQVKRCLDYERQRDSLKTRLQSVLSDIEQLRHNMQQNTEQ